MSASTKIRVHRFLCLIFLVIIISLFPVPGFAQAFVNMPFSNPDRWTYFQQEMTSLTWFQIENDFNSLLFMSMSTRFSTLKYKDEYLGSLHGLSFPYGRGKHKDKFKGSEDVNLLLGAQTRVSSTLYVLPFITHIGQATSYGIVEEYEYIYHGIERKGPIYVAEERGGTFLGTGVFINTDTVKSGIYFGLASDDTASSSAFRIAIVPMVNTSGFAYVGRVLNNVFGYLGLGNNVVNSPEEQEDFRIRALVNSLNAALNLSFNRVDLGPLALYPQLLYTRGNFDAAAKNDIFGLRTHGVFSESQFGFTLEGGYKHFFSVSRFFLSDYPDTGYFKGSLFYRSQHTTFGAIYYFDNIHKSKLTLALSLNLPLLSPRRRTPSVLDMSGFWTLNPPRQYMDKEKSEPYLSFELGTRYRFGW
ncbi:MAG: hypothetical protein FWD87_05920 [Spirochaetaceae bacterium]|nr:hypothetical protein [Spirochaetaceae bacterium]